ncbi:phosphotransferase family protein [Nocardioides perillae]|uniref:Aminoglycoside phosphotransferase (APT) family kinase protein n=1 Tax=Nocardioides perillae TaxID=1119534 RepID=A0A7Y9RVK0_9ACTN|nr:aminoglycoside phosphotransferase (APT) family kinase protein [Nocardioides perillae]
MSVPDPDDLLTGGLVPLAGGWSGETFLSDLTALGGERTVVRVYAARGRPAEAPEVDAAVLRLVRGLVPVPDVLEVRRGRADAPGLLVTSWVPGDRLDEVLPALDADGQARVGAAVGRVAADLAGMPQLERGWFLDAGLRVQPWRPDLPAYVDEVGARLVGWTPDERGGLLAVAEEAQDRLETLARASLVHGDLNPKNVLVDPGSLEVTAVVDWEFAHAGLPTADLGNLVRWDRAPGWVEAVVGAWAERHGHAVADALDLARSADLFALVELAVRGGSPPARRAAEQLRAVARARDVHAC